MLKNLQKRNQGFTIVEVMIVLAIAGLIILVVLLAVPALQRNSRNTTVKNAASAVAGAISEYQGANNGRMPTTVAIANGTITVSGAGTPVTGKTQGGTTGAGSTTATAPTATELGVINVRIGAKCNDAGTAIGAADNRAAAVLYNVETSGAPAPACVDS